MACGFKLTVALAAARAALMGTARPAMAPTLLTPHAEEIAVGLNEPTTLYGIDLVVATQHWEVDSACELQQGSAVHCALCDVGSYPHAEDVLV